MKFVIFNADDFGYTRGVNRGIAEAHRKGVVTSATLIVNGLATEEAVQMAREMPGLSVGLHVNFTNEAQRLVDFDDPQVASAEMRRQLDRFVSLVGRLPTHLDSHQHVHRHPVRRKLFEQLATEHGLPLRDTPPVAFMGGFYAQWEYGVTDLSKVSVAALERMIRDEVKDGVTEFGCHPGYFDEAMEMVYHRDRETELRTLCDPRVREILREEGIRLIGFGQLGEALATIGA